MNNFDKKIKDLKRILTILESLQISEEIIPGFTDDYDSSRSHYYFTSHELDIEEFRELLKPYDLGGDKNFIQEETSIQLSNFYNLNLSNSHYNLEIVTVFNLYQEDYDNPKTDYLLYIRNDGYKTRRSIINKLKTDVEKFEILGKINQEVNENFKRKRI